MATIAQALDSLKAARSEAQKELTRLDAAIRALQNVDSQKAVGRSSSRPKSRRKMSAAARRKISAAQKARWAKVRKQKVANG